MSTNPVPPEKRRPDPIVVFMNGIATGIAIAHLIYLGLKHFFL